MAFRIAVSGLRSASSDLDVTGNNIANAGTTGFKASRAEFADIYAVSSLGTTSDAIGQGVQMSAVSQQFTQGNIAFTDNSLDLAINGQGFFVLEDNGTRTYTRAGAFGVDSEGYVVNSTGQNLMGYQAVDGEVTGAIDKLQVDTSNLAPSATTRIDTSLNLDAGADAPVTVPFDATDPTSYNNSTSLTIYDSLGEQHLANMYFVSTGANTWDVHLQIDDQDPAAPTSASIAFDNSGALLPPVNLSFGAFAATGTGSDPITLDVDLTGTTQYGADYGVYALSQDGYTTGQLAGLEVDEHGVVYARFTNGQSDPLGQVLMANFSNPQGLQPMGDTIWAETNSSGAPLEGAAGSATLGLIQAGALEESNVELAEQLVNMIIAQRSFQANAQVIRTEDDVTQTIINIR